MNQTAYWVGIDVPKAQLNCHIRSAAEAFQVLHPEPRNGIAVAASASAGDSEAEARVVIYLPSNGRGDYPDADLVSESETTIDVLGSSVN